MNYGDSLLNPQTPHAHPPIIMSLSKEGAALVFVGPAVVARAGAGDGGEQGKLARIGGTAAFVDCQADPGGTGLGPCDEPGCAG